MNINIIDKYFLTKSRTYFVHIFKIDQNTIYANVYKITSNGAVSQHRSNWVFDINGREGRKMFDIDFNSECDDNGNLINKKKSFCLCNNSNIFGHRTDCVKYKKENV